jgi:hypothetical protein
VHASPSFSTTVTRTGRTLRKGLSQHTVALTHPFSKYAKRVETILAALL